ncbi:T9SS type A sorting domain-containing protein [Polaribacter sp.]|uniref:T9SS type A sorting domain-containing protein n=1 Tax=Polaribacter sp. TaxID=1920175 RepID=UPI003F6BD02F
MKQKFFLTTLLCFFVTFGLMAQTDYYVSASGDNSDGLTLGTAFTTVNAAVNAATAGDNIIINGSVTDTQKTLLDKNLTFTGQSSASVTQTAAGNLFDVRAAINITFTDITFDGISNTGAGGVLNAFGAAANITFTNCILSNNSATGGNGGGAIFIGNSVTVTLTNSVLKDNSATAGGAGAVAVNGSGTLNVSGSTFYNNSCTTQGGAIRMISTASCTVSNSTFFNNSTSSTATFDGGGIRANSNNNTITITNSLFYNNLDGNNTAADISASSGATASIENTLAQYETNFSATNSNATADLTNSNLAWNATENRVEFTAPEDISDDTPIDFGSDNKDVGAWDSEINIFEGTTNQTWSVATNWSSGTAPVGDGTEDIAVLSICNMFNDVAINDIKVTSQLRIQNGNVFIVNGTSDITGTVRYFRDLQNDADVTKAWYLVSSPLTGEVFDTAFADKNDIASGTGSNRGIATYNAASNDWTYFNGTAINATSGKGFSAKITPDGITFALGGGEYADNALGFEGDLNTADVSTAVVTDGNGFNLLGNPYPANINTATFLTDNTANLASETIWVWDSSAGNYITHVTAEAFILAPTQGFFVKASANANVNFAKSNQALSGGTFQKAGKQEVHLLMTDGSSDRFARILYTENATTDFDNGYDGQAFEGIANNLDVYTNLVAKSEGEKYQIQALPNTDLEDLVIPVGVTAEAGKTITFSALVTNLPTELSVYLEDRPNNTFTKLDENGEYTVTLDTAVNGSGRFFLHTSSSVLSTDDVVLTGVNVYTVNNSLRITGINSTEAGVEVYNILGKKVLDQDFSSRGSTDIRLPKLSLGVYIVNLTTEKGKISKKIILE